MAEATRSQVIRRDVDGRIEELQTIGDQRHAEVKGELTQIQNSMNMMSGQLMEVLHQNLNQARGQY